MHICNYCHMQITETYINKKTMPKIKKIVASYYGVVFLKLIIKCL